MGNEEHKFFLGSDSPGYHPSGDVQETVGYLDLGLERERDGLKIQTWKIKVVETM